MEEFRQALKKEVFTAADMEPYQLTKEDLCKIEELAEKKYRSWEWTYGFFPEYSISREEIKTRMKEENQMKMAFSNAKRPDQQVIVCDFGRIRKDFTAAGQSAPYSGFPCSRRAMAIWQTAERKND